MLTSIMWPVEMSMFEWAGSSLQEERLLRAEGLMAWPPSLNWDDTLLILEEIGSARSVGGLTAIRCRQSSCRRKSGDRSVRAAAAGNEKFQKTWQNWNIWRIIQLEAPQHKLTYWTLLSCLVLQLSKWMKHLKQHYVTLTTTRGFDKQNLMTPVNTSHKTAIFVEPGHILWRNVLWFSLWRPLTALPQLWDSRRFLKATCRLPADQSSSCSSGSLSGTALLNKRLQADSCRTSEGKPEYIFGTRFY